MAVVLCYQFLTARPDIDAAPSTVIADAIHCEVIGHIAVVDVGDVCSADIDHRPVIEEGPASPFSAHKAYAGVTEPIINAAVEAYVGTPVACVPEKCSSAPAPVPRRPQHARGRATTQVPGTQ